MKCNLCGSERLRLSHLHSGDVPHLLSFEYPVRCAVCFDRMFVNFYQAYGVHHRAGARRRAALESRRTAPHTKPNGA